jgi:hypothetical protein
VSVLCVRVVCLRCVSVLSICDVCLCCVSVLFVCGVCIVCPFCVRESVSKPLSVYMRTFLRMHEGRFVCACVRMLACYCVARGRGLRDVACRPARVGPASAEKKAAALFLARFALASLTATASMVAELTGSPRPTAALGRRV